MTTRRLRQRLTLFALLVLFSGCSGVGYGWLFEPGIASTKGLNVFLVDGVIGGLLIFGFEIFALPGRHMAPLRRRPFWVVTVIRSIIVFACIFITGSISSFIHLGEFQPLRAMQAGWGLFLYVGLFVFLAGFVMQILRITGPRVLGNLIIGQYHKPVEENRIFLFLDIANSTKLSQELGALGAQALVSRLFFELGVIVNEHGGEIHRYVGDAMVAIWPFSDDPKRNQEALACSRDLMSVTASLAALCQAEFGASTHWRIGLHGGPVVASECGDIKQEIVYFGDTVNTAARIEAACKNHRATCLISDFLLANSVLPMGLAASNIGQVDMKGRAEAMSLHRLNLA